jgi:hypothetical protein
LSRATWAFAGLGLLLIALLMIWMGKTLDTKAPVRIERPTSAPVGVVPTMTPEEEAAREENAMRALVSGRAGALALRAAAQAYPSEDASRVRCTFTEARLVHRDGAAAYWSAGFSCVDPRQPEALPNLTSVSVRLHRDEMRWAVEE